MHEVETGPYLIALNETTFGEWIEFLRALPKGKRKARTPDVDRQGRTVVLTELPDGAYELALGRDEKPNVAREGKPIRYQDTDRAGRAVQDWSRIPVTGISFDDMLAYMAWLRDSGRVPGARPCNEHEWERAARGADGRTFPHGEQLEPGDANHDRTYGQVSAAFGPDEVGSYPASDSPYGVHDLAGNVWEWTAAVADPDVPVARGGGFFQASVWARAENRSRDVRDHRDAYYGIRVCASVHAQ
jgi:formylglycine-generating enzyme required for sulfatase activity